MTKLEDQLTRLEQQLSRVKPEKIIRHTQESVARMGQVRRESSWRGREIALNQEEVRL